MQKVTSLALCIVMLTAANAFAADCANLPDNPPVKDLIACIKEQQKALTDLRQSLLSGNGEPTSTGAEQGSGDKRDPTLCPEGLYAVGINWWAAPGTTKYCVGCVNGIQVICKKLNVK